jgi:predicted RecB family nuclease
VQALTNKQLHKEPIMSRQLTRKVLEAYLHCRYKGHLTQTDEPASPSDFEILTTGQLVDVRSQAFDRIAARQPGIELVREVSLTKALLKEGPVTVLDALLQDDVYSLRFDGLMRVDGPSKLGDFHYIPMLFHAGGSVRVEQRLLLEVYGLLLSRFQGRAPGSGIVWHGRSCRATKIRLSPDPRKARRLLQEIEQARDADAPRLILNDHCNVCGFRQRCHEQAIREDSLSLLRGLGDKEIKGYARKGILTLTQLAYTFRPRRKGKRAAPRLKRRYHSLQARAIRDKRVYLFGTPEVPAAPVQIYLDLEGLPDEKFVYLIGMTVVESGAEQHLTFWSDSPEQEMEMFRQFQDEANKYPDARIYCYGTYEQSFLKRMRMSAPKKGPVDKLLGAVVNILSVVYAHAYFPCYSNGLKDVAGCLGCTWSDPQSSGLQSIVWRKRWEATHSDEWRDRLVKYNKEDCAALRIVAEFLQAHGAGAEKYAKPGTTGGPPVASVEEIDRLVGNRVWGEVAFVHTDYKLINRCAQFDYQRQRVYARTCGLIRKACKKPRKQTNRKLRTSQRVQIIAHKCPRCGGVEIVASPSGKSGCLYRTRCKRSFDLVFTSVGIRRRVIECRTSVHECRTCGANFTPACYERVAKFFHGLMSWAMHEHVVFQASFQAIQQRFWDFFGLSVPDPEIMLFKTLMARYYRSAYRQLLNTILAGPVLHADETEVKLKKEKGYVWVLAAPEAVVYMYRPNREGDFLPKILKDFCGVLVSDFYSVYDALPCAQQKCLIHLLRDMNQELLNNPFDAELNSITGPFGKILRAIVEEIDRHGLKTRYLRPHDRTVVRFFDDLAAQSFKSEAAEALRAKLLRYRNKLYTFLHHDGVAWNNNPAENAIKRFAYYREGTVGVLTETGLSNYLVLLSLYQTCRCRGVSFLKFLLSRQRDLDGFCEHPRRKPRGSSIELYPSGVTRVGFKLTTDGPDNPPASFESSSPPKD